MHLSSILLHLSYLFHLSLPFQFSHSLSLSFCLCLTRVGVYMTWGERILCSWGKRIQSMIWIVVRGGSNVGVGVVVIWGHKDRLGRHTGRVTTWVWLIGNMCPLGGRVDKGFRQRRLHICRIVIMVI